MQCETMNNMQGTLLKFSLLQFKWPFDSPIKEQFVQIFNYIYSGLLSMLRSDWLSY